MAVNASRVPFIIAGVLIKRDSAMPISRSDRMIAATLYLNRRRVMRLLRASALIQKSRLRARTVPPVSVLLAIVRVSPINGDVSLPSLFARSFISEYPKCRYNVV